MKTNISYQLSSFADVAFDVCPRSIEGTSCNGGFSFFKISSTFTLFSMPVEMLYQHRNYKDWSQKFLPLPLLRWKVTQVIYGFFTLRFHERELYLYHFNWLWTKFPNYPNAYFLITFSYDRNVLLHCNNYSYPIHPAGSLNAHGCNQHSISSPNYYATMSSCELPSLSHPTFFNLRGASLGH